MGVKQGLHGVCKKQLRGETDWRKGLSRTPEWSHETDGPGVLSVRFRVLCQTGENKSFAVNRDQSHRPGPQQECSLKSNSFTYI